MHVNKNFENKIYTVNMVGAAASVFIKFGVFFDELRNVMWSATFDMLT
jgi:hypothetical protein